MHVSQKMYRREVASLLHEVFHRKRAKSILAAMSASPACMLPKKCTDGRLRRFSMKYSIERGRRVYLPPGVHASQKMYRREVASLLHEVFHRKRATSILAVMSASPACMLPKKCTDGRLRRFSMKCSIERGRRVYLPHGVHASQKCTDGTRRVASLMFVKSGFMHWYFWRAVARAMQTREWCRYDWVRGRLSTGRIVHAGAEHSHTWVSWRGQFEWIPSMVDERDAEA